MVGMKNLIDALIDVDMSDEIILVQAKKKYGDYFTDDELEEFIAEAKGKTLQEA